MNKAKSFCYLYVFRYLCQQKQSLYKMRCPNCNTEINEKANHCPHCGTPIPRKEDEPTLGRGIVTFIIIGTFSLVGFGFFYYGQHK